MSKIYNGKCGCSGKISGKIVSSLEQKGILIMDTLKPSEFLNPEKTQGFVMRRGGILSHGAIVAREFNIPCIVAVDIPKIKEGTEVELNATEGYIQIK